VAGLIVGAAVAIVAALLGTPLLIRTFQANGIVQPIHDAVTQHEQKAGTPTMGGSIISVTAVVGYGAARLYLGQAPTADGLRVMGAVLAAAVVGGVDDFRKVRSRRNVGGLSRRAKTALLAPLIVAYCAAHLWAGSCAAISITRCAEGASLDLGPVVWFVFAAGFLWVTSNAVNFADGLEGLLAGSGAVTLTALVLIALWQFRHPADYDVTNALDLGIVAACLAAACVGFLWWNGNPMTIFMGDVGSLAVGTAVAALALSLGVSLLFVVLGALYVIEGASVGLQISTWKWYWKPRGGQRRLFRMAPLHHHFELSGWSEATVLVRFWILNALSAGLALAIFYLDTPAAR
jgi:phospho-N-acetylmuramoyl-pentapeptide-transferase